MTQPSFFFGKKSITLVVMGLRRNWHLWENIIHQKGWLGRSVWCGQANSVWTGPFGVGRPVWCGQTSLVCAFWYFGSFSFVTFWCWEIQPHKLRIVYMQARMRFDDKSHLGFRGYCIPVLCKLNSEKISNAVQFFGVGRPVRCWHFGVCVHFICQIFIRYIFVLGNSTT